MDIWKLSLFFFSPGHFLEQSGLLNKVLHRIEQTLLSYFYHLADIRIKKGHFVVGYFVDGCSVCLCQRYDYHKKYNALLISLLVACSWFMG